MDRPYSRFLTGNPPVFSGQNRRKPLLTANPNIQADDRTVHARMKIVLHVEGMALALRYVVYATLAVLCVFIYDDTLRRAFIAAGLSALTHNLFSHWVFYSRRHALFVSPWNFLLYLLRFCLLVGLTGGPASPLAPLFLSLLIGYHIYSRRPKSFNSLWITLVVSAAYSFVIVADWIIERTVVFPAPVYINLFFIGCFGWLTYYLAQVLSDMERTTEAKTSALKSSEATLRAIFDHTAHPILVYDEAEIIMDVNESACDFLGLSRDELTGLRFQSLLFDDGTLAALIETLKQSGSLHHEMLVLPANEQERSVYMHIHSFLRGGRRLFVALFHDITDQKELREAHRAAKLNLEKANKEMQHVVDLRAAFYINVANRLRSPLSAILGFTDMLLEEHLGKISTEQRQALHSCRRSLTNIFSQLDEAFMLDVTFGQEEVIDDTSRQDTSDTDTLPR